MRSPFVVSNGIGVNTVALLVGHRVRGIRPDRILFADTGSEKRRTHEYRTLVLDPWPAAIGFPPTITVRYVVQRPRNGPCTTLEERLDLADAFPRLPAWRARRRGCQILRSRTGYAPSEGVRSALPQDVLGAARREGRKKRPSREPHPLRLPVSLKEAPRGRVVGAS